MVGDIKYFSTYSLYTILGGSEPALGHGGRSIMIYRQTFHYLLIESMNCKFFSCEKVGIGKCAMDEDCIIDQSMEPETRYVLLKIICKKLLLFFLDLFSVIFGKFHQLIMRRK